MIAVVAGTDAKPGCWRLVSRTATGADVLAHGAVPAAAPARTGSAQPWLRSLERMCDGAGELSVTATGDGHFQWTLTARDGDVLAQSPPVYRNPDACRHAFTDAQRAARAALGRRRPANPPPRAAGDDPPRP